jgi:hypothetical protein
MGGVSLARKFVETKIRYLDYDPLEIDTGFRFPRLQEIDAEASSEDEENKTEDDEGEGENEGEKDEDKPLEEKEG